MTDSERMMCTPPPYYWPAPDGCTKAYQVDWRSTRMPDPGHRSGTDQLDELAPSRRPVIQGSTRTSEREVRSTRLPPRRGRYARCPRYNFSIDLLEAAVAVQGFREHSAHARRRRNAAGRILRPKADGAAPSSTGAARDSLMPSTPHTGSGF